MSTPIFLFIGHPEIINNMRKAYDEQLTGKRLYDSIFTWIIALARESNGEFGKFLLHKTSTALTEYNQLTEHFFEGICFATDEDMAAFIKKWS